MKRLVCTCRFYAAKDGQKHTITNRVRHCLTMIRYNIQILFMYMEYAFQAKLINKRFEGNLQSKFEYVNWVVSIFYGKDDVFERCNDRSE